MVEKTLEYFSMAQICDSGQCFRMARAAENRWSVIASGRYLEVTQEGKRCLFHCSQEEYEQFWKQYFDLDTDYGVYIEKINPNDRYLAGAARYGFGIRILRQEPWEMIVTFLISQQNNIVRIRRCIRNICERYGEKKVTAEGVVYYAFPEPAALAVLDEDALKDCNLGYRSKYVVRAAKAVRSGELDLAALEKMSYKKARETLMQLYGVGEKVADCICLFGLHHLEAFPVDIHIRQVLDIHYKRGFPNRRYKGIRGVMQQYIFYYSLQN